MQSLKDAKAESTKEDGVVYNSEGDPLLPIGCDVNVKGHDPDKPHRMTIVRYRTFDEESHTDCYVVEANGEYDVVHYSEVAPIK